MAYELDDSNFCDLHILEHPLDFKLTERVRYLRSLAPFLRNKWLGYYRNGNLVKNFDNIPTYHLPPILLNNSMYCSTVSVVLMYCVGLREVIDCRGPEASLGIRFLRSVMAGCMDTEEIVHRLNFLDVLDFKYPRIVNNKLLDMLEGLVTGHSGSDPIPENLGEYVVVYNSNYVPPADIYRPKATVLYKNYHVILQYEANGHTHMGNTYHDNDLNSKCSGIDSYKTLMVLYKTHRSIKHQNYCEVPEI
jgi:hypothetical protein